MQSLMQSLERMIRGTSYTSIVLDALDECTTRPTLLSWLTQLARQEIKNLQIVATSRTEHDIEIAFEKCMQRGSKVSMKQLAVDADIRAYVRARIHSDPSLDRWRKRPDVQGKIEAELMQKAAGM